MSFPPDSRSCGRRSLGTVLPSNRYFRPPSLNPFSTYPYIESCLHSSYGQDCCGENVFVLAAPVVASFCGSFVPQEMRESRRNRGVDSRSRPHSRSCKTPKCPSFEIHPNDIRKTIRAGHGANPAVPLMRPPYPLNDGSPTTHRGNSLARDYLPTLKYIAGYLDSRYLGKIRGTRRRD